MRCHPSVEAWCFGLVLAAGCSPDTTVAGESGAEAGTSTDTGANEPEPVDVIDGHAVITDSLDDQILRWDGSGEPEVYPYDFGSGVVRFFGRDQLHVSREFRVERLSFGAELDATTVFAFEDIAAGAGVGPSSSAGWEVTSEGLLRWDWLEVSEVAGGPEGFVDLWVDAEGQGWAIEAVAEGAPPSLWRVEGEGASSSDPVLPADVELRGIWGRAQDDVWAVGQREVEGQPETRGVILRFDGQAWSELPDPGFEARAFIEITGTEDGRVLVVQDTLGDADAEVLAFEAGDWTAPSYLNATQDLDQAQLVAVGEHWLLRVGPGLGRFYTLDEVGWDSARDTWPEVPSEVLALVPDGAGGAWTISKTRLLHFDGESWRELELQGGIRADEGLGLVPAPGAVVIRERSHDPLVPSSPKASARAWYVGLDCLE